MGTFRWYTIPLVAVVLAVVTGLSIRLAELLPAGILPVQFSAGVALAALLINGQRCWPGVFLGVYGASLWLAGMDGYSQALFDAAVISVQALVAGLLVRPLLRGEMPMSRDGEVLRFLLLAGPVACLVSAAATQLPRLSGDGFELLQPWTGDLLHGDWLTAWSANTLGVLVVGPPALVLWSGVRNLRRVWGARVVLPLVLSALLVMVGHVTLLRFEMREVELQDNTRLESVLQGGLVHFDRGIEALHSVELFFHASRLVREEEFALFTDRMLRWAGLDSIEWVPRVVEAPPSEGEEGLITSADHALPSARSADRYPSLYSVASSGDSPLRVFDYRAVPTRWAAMEKARDSGKVVAAEPQPLLQTGRPGLSVVIPLYPAGFASGDATVAERREALRGFIKGNFDLTNLVEPLSAAAATQGVRLALADLTPGSAPMVLLNDLPAEARTSERRHFSFGGRLLQLDLALVTGWVPGRGPVARLYQGFSVLAMLLMALAVLASAGRHSAAQAAVQARTAALRASERHLEVTLDSIGDGVLVIDTEGCVARLNPMAEQLTGWRSRQAQGRPLAEVFRIVDEDDRQPVAVPVTEVLAGGIRRWGGNRTVLIDHSGAERGIAHIAAPIIGAGEEQLGVVLVFRDISEERAAERALEASEQRYRELIEQAPYGVFVQTGGCFAYLNPTALRLLGARAPSELLGKPVLDFLHPDSRDTVAERIRQLNLLGMPAASREEKWLRLDGSVFQAEATAAPHVHDGERGSLVMLRDISARKAAESQRDRFFELSLDPQCILDASGRFLRVNAAFSEVLGWSNEEFPDYRYFDLIHPDERAQVEQEHGNLRAEHGAQRLEVRFRRRAGDWRWLSWNAVADEHGGLIYAVARDVTERRETIQALTRARHEAEYANRAKSAFLATMSHEIRTPMNAVVGLSEVLTHSRLGEHDEELVRNIGVSARSLLRLIDDILDFSKIEAGRLELEQAPVTIEVMVEDLCQALLPMARERRVALSLFVDPALPRQILGDEVRLRQLFNNLIGNAIKFSAAPGSAGGEGRVQVRVEAEEEGATLTLTVKDNGIGMSRDILDHIFQPFTQGELSTTRRYGGTGLGLAICKRLVDLMGGELGFDSREGQGTRAAVALPLQAVPTAQGGEEVELFPDLGGICCLLVDTAEIAGEDWQRYLHSAGATAICAPTLAAALAHDAGGQLRVIILDLREPAHSTLPVNAAFDGDGDIRFVLVDTGRRGGTRLQGGRMVIIEGGALRRRQLLQAVAIAAERGQSAASPATVGAESPSPGVPVAGEHRILVVEDDEMNRKVIIEQLRLLGYTAEVAADGNSALALWRERRHDLIFTDLNMPEMDGYDFVRILRSEEESATHTPVVALSANAMRGEDSRARARGLDDYLTKPVSLEALGAVLRHWLSPGAGKRSSSDAENPAMTAVARPDNSALDLAILSEFIGGDDTRINNFVADYRQAAIQLRGEIFAARERGDLAALASFAHRLKSSSLWVGAVSLGDACGRLEKAALNADRVQVDDCLATFASAHDEALAAIDRHLLAVSHQQSTPRA